MSTRKKKKRTNARALRPNEEVVGMCVQHSTAEQSRSQAAKQPSSQQKEAVIGSGSLPVI